MPAGRCGGQEVTMLQLKNIKKVYNGVPILNGISLDIGKGEIVSILGPSGSGKTTLLNVILGLAELDGGQILFDGEDVSGTPMQRRGFNIVFQDYALFPNLNAYRNITYGLKNKPGVSSPREVRELVELLGLSEHLDKRIDQLSGGQKQRVAIARALSTEPRVLLCDEATSALDPETTDSILGLIRDINKRLGITAVVITHEMDVIEKICSKVAIISKGVIAETGTVNEVFFHPRSEIARRLVVPEALHPDKMKLPKLYRLIFDGQSSFDPVVSNMVLACGKPVNIMYASTQDIGGTAFGQMVLQLPEDEESIARIQAYVKEHGLYLEEFTHA